MSKLVVITDLGLVNGDIKQKILNFAKCGVDVVLRAKELSLVEYEKFASEILEICSEYREQIFVHKFSEVALNLGTKNLWLPLSEFEGVDLSKFKKVVASIHSLDEVEKALNLGANIISLSHIFKTECKKELEPKGVQLIKEVKVKFGREIYALGGINESNFKECLNAGASKICVMSSAMKCKDESKFVYKFRVDY